MKSVFNIGSESSHKNKTRGSRVLTFCGRFVQKRLLSPSANFLVAYHSRRQGKVRTIETQFIALSFVKSDKLIELIEEFKTLVTMQVWYIGITRHCQC